MKARWRSTDAPLSSLRRMIHSASFLATGSDIAASVWVASTGLCLRTSSMTFSSASVSACEVDDVAATAACGAGLRAGAGGKAACWRVAGAMAGATGAGVATAAVFLAAAPAAGARAGAGVAAGAIFLATTFTAGARAGLGVATGAMFLAAVLVAGAVILVEALGTTLRAIGRGFGSGTVGVSQASAANTDNPTASARLVANVVDRNAAARNDGVTAFLRGESVNRSSPGCISLICGQNAKIEPA